MALNVKVGNFNVNTSTGNQSVTGVGFQPKVVIFTPGGSDLDENSPNAPMSFGVGISSTNRRAATFRSFNSLGAPNSGSYHSATHCIMQSNGGTSSDGEADFVSQDADGFTINVTDAFADDYKTFYLALGGDDLTNVTSGQFQSNTSSGTQSITGVGFQPDAIILFGVNNTVAPPDGLSGVAFSLGFASSSSKRGALALGARHFGVPSSSDTFRYQRTNYAYVAVDSTTSNGAVLAEADLQSFDADGFTLNWVTAPALSQYIHYIAFKGPRFSVGSFDTQTGTGNFSVTGAGLQAVAGIFASYLTSAQTTLQTNAELSLGFATSSSERGVVNTSMEDAVSGGDIDGRTASTLLYTNTDFAATTEGDADFVSWDSDGFTLNQTDADPSANQVLYFLIAQGVSSAANSVKANIVTTNTKDNSAKGNIYFLRTADNSVTANIKGTSQQNNSVKANIISTARTTLVLETMASTPSGTLKNVANYVSGQYVELTDASTNVSGQLEYTDSTSRLMVNNFKTTFEFLTGNGTGADAVYFYWGNSDTPLSEVHAKGGYIVAYDEYEDQLGMNFNGSDIVAATAQTGLDNAEWRKAEVHMNGLVIDMYLDGSLVKTFTDTARTLGGGLFGWGARTGAGTNDHLIRNLQVDYIGKPSFVKANIVLLQTNNNSAKASVLTANVTKNASAKGNLYFQPLQDNSSKANVKNTITNNNSAKANIKPFPSKKTYEYRVYDNNVYVTTWATEVLSEPKFRTVINGGASELIVKLNRTFDDFSEDDDVKLYNRVDLWCFDRDARNGVRIYRGYIGGYRPVLEGNNEYIEVSVLSFIAETSGYIYRTGAGATTIAHSSVDPASIARLAIDNYRGYGGTLDYTADSIDDTGTSVSYTFNTNTIKEVLDKVVELCPAGWYYYVDASGLVNLHAKEDTATHTFRVGREVTQMETWRRGEDIVNEVFFVGGGSPQMYRYYKNDGSISAYGRRSIKKVDQRVTNTATADIMVTSIINAKKDPEVRTTITINDNNGKDSARGYDIESIRVGDTFQIGNLNQGTKTVTLWDVGQWDVDVWDQTLSYLATTAVQILSIDYSPERVVLEASSRLPEVSKRIEDINRNAETTVLINNPSSPTAA